MFSLDPRLAAETVEVTRLPLCRVLLRDDARFPWLILVPERADLRELHHLPPADQTRLMAELAVCSEALESLFQPHKLNVAALGNVVPQLHVHVIARFRHDPAWPGPVWGVGERVPYAEGELVALRERLRAALVLGFGV